MIRLVEGSEDSSITDFEVKCRDGAQPRAVRERERRQAAEIYETWDLGLTAELNQESGKCG